MKKILLIATILLFFSCKKKEEPQPTQQSQATTHIYGCMTVGATNYNPQATSDQCGSCACYWSTR